MPSGRFNQQVRIEQQGTTNDATYGPQPGTWSELATVWAEVDEFLPAQAETGVQMRNAVRPARIRTWFRSDVTTSMRVVLVDRGNRLMKIVGGPTEIGRRQYIDLMVEEFTSEGDAP